MRLSPGTRVGSYEVVETLGAGGLGEVYRARDTRLDRTVAIRRSSPSSSPPTRTGGGFQREAKTLAALNHPNVAQIYGVETVSGESGTYALAMEFVDGEDLAQRLARGPLPIDEAIAIARQTL